MATSKLIPSLSQLNEKLLSLIQAYNTLSLKVKKLEEENHALKSQHETDIKLLNKAKADIEFLTVSHRLAENADSLISTRRHIARLIRTIDNCIQAINDD